MADKPAPRPTKMETINQKVWAPDAIGELNISSNIYTMVWMS